MNKSRCQCSSLMSACVNKTLFGVGISLMSAGVNKTLFGARISAGVNRSTCVNKTLFAVGISVDVNRS